MQKSNLDASVPTGQTVKSILAAKGAGEPEKSIRKCIDPDLLDKLAHESSEKRVLTAVMENPFTNQDTVFKLAFKLKSYHTKLTSDILKYRDLSEVNESLQVEMAKLVKEIVEKELSQGKNINEVMKWLNDNFVQPCFENLKGPLEFLKAFFEEDFLDRLKKEKGGEDLVNAFVKKYKKVI